MDVKVCLKQPDCKFNSHNFTAHIDFELLKQTFLYIIHKLQNKKVHL